MAGATRSIIIDAPREKVFQVVTDYENYPRFLPEMSAARLLRRSGNTAEVAFTIKVVMDVSYSLRLVEEAPERVSWTLLDGKMMKSNVGGWTLEALGPTQTKATYTIEVGLKGLVPKSVSTGLVETTLPKTLEAFKARAESL